MLTEAVLTLFSFYKKPSSRPSPQYFLKKLLLEPSKFLHGFLISRILVLKQKSSNAINKTINYVQRKNKLIKSRIIIISVCVCIPYELTII